MRNKTQYTMGLVWEFIARYQNQHKYSPSFAEIKKALEFKATSHVIFYLTKLTNNGHITRSPRIARGIQMLNIPESHIEEYASFLIDKPFADLEDEYASW